MSTGSRFFDMSSSSSEDDTNLQAGDVVPRARGGSSHQASAYSPPSSSRQVIRITEDLIRTHSGVGSHLPLTSIRVLDLHLRSRGKGGSGESG